MRLKELTKKEFDLFAINHPLGSFQQTSNWGRFMEGDKFHAYYVGGTIKEKLVGASLLLSYEYKNNIRFFYAPRGFLIDYKNEELLKEFTEEVKKFIKEKHGVYLKIDPYILLRDRDSKGNIIDGGVYNDFVEINLKNTGFIRVYDTIQPKWLSRINLKNITITDIIDNFSPKARQTIRRNEKLGFKVRNLEIENIDKFMAIMEKEAKTYHTIMATKKFYYDLKQAFGNNIVFKEVYFKKDEVINNIEKMILNINNKKEERINNYHSTKMTTDYFIDKELKDEENIKRLEELKVYFSKTSDEVTMGIYLYINIGNEVLAFNGGIVDEYNKLDASYTLHYEMIKYAINNGYKYYNLYEIGNITDSNNKLKNSFNYKKNFGGEVIELVGEYDLEIDSKYTDMARKHFPTYLGVKTIFK